MDEIRLIDANALLKKCIEVDGNNKFTEGYNFAVQEISAYIALAPTIDAQPVKRGEWETKGGVHCTRCGWRPTGRICDLFTDYCAGCGAKMDGDSDE